VQGHAPAPRGWKVSARRRLCGAGHELRPVAKRAMLSRARLGQQRSERGKSFTIEIPDTLTESVSPVVAAFAIADGRLWSVNSMLVCGTSVVPGLVGGYTPVGLCRVEDGMHVRLCWEEDRCFEPSLGLDGSVTLLQLPTDVLLIVFRKMGGAGVLPFVCRRFRDVVARGLATGALDKSSQVTEDVSLFLRADYELWSRREFLGEDGLTRALLSAPWQLGPHVVEQACALLRRLPLQAQLMALTPCFAWTTHSCCRTRGSGAHGRGAGTAQSTAAGAVRC
jgi:hypothetical protein